MTVGTKNLFIVGTTVLIGVSGPSLAALYRGGLEQLLTPQTLATTAITASLFYVVSNAWSRVSSPDERREQLEAAVREAEEKFFRSTEDGSLDLAEIQGEADDRISQKVEELEAAFADAPEAVTHLEIEIPIYLNARRSDQDLAEGAIAEGFGELRQLIDGRGIALPSQMSGRPDLSADWADPHAIATTNWRKVLEDRREDIVEMRVAAPAARSRIQAAYDASLAAFDGAIERLRTALRLNTMQDQPRSLPGSE
ncbi:MAG: hypothetical protein AAF636_19310 [Pseudomonadota bacterium]